MHANHQEVISNGKRLRGANDDVAMVFQSFALLPWLTVQENVELGLDAKGVGREERRRRALKAIDLVGLDGFESAYPKELSGGMKQRVGFARAFVLEPKDLFRQQVLENVPMLVSMVQTLREKRNRSRRADLFIDLLDQYYPHEEAER